MHTTSTSPDPILSAYLAPCLATAYVPTPSSMPDPGERLDVELRNLEGRLRDLEVDEGAAGRLVSAIREAGHPAGNGIVALLGVDGTRVWHTAAELQAEVVPGPLPALSRFLLARQQWIPHAVVLIDRVGADVTIVDSTTSQTEVSVDGATTHLTKSNPGGWSQRRFQQRAEEHWQDNAELVAQQLGSELAGTDVDLIVLAGDETARSVLMDVLPQHLAEMVVEIEGGGRAEDGSADQVEADVDATVRREAAARREAALSTVADSMGAGQGATGRTQVLEALFEGRAGTVVIDVAAAADVVAHHGPEPMQVAADSAVLHDLGLDAARGPLVDVVLRGAAATGAQVILLDGARAGSDDPLDQAVEDDAITVGLPEGSEDLLEDGVAATIRGHADQQEFAS